MKLNTIILISLCLWTPWPWATQDDQQAKRLIKEILEHPDFQTTTRESHFWRYIRGNTPKQAPSSSNLGSHAMLSLKIAQFLEWMLWILFGIGSLFFILRIQNHFGSFSFFIPSPPLPPRELTVNFVSQEPLPSHLAQYVWELWQTGEVRVAISLLYRGTLSVLNTQKGQSIQESATERECLNWVKSHHPEFHNYFFKLTMIWQSVAYAQRLPQDEEVQVLCEEWAHYFGE